MIKDYTNKEYEKYVQQKSPDSKSAKDTVMAFVVGGLICVIAECIADYMRMRQVDEETVKLALPVIMVFLSAFLTGLGIYEKIAKFAGAGTIVPITGFANAVCSPAMEFHSEGIVMGIGAKMFVIAGPVIVFGTITSIVVGFLYFLFG